jgi:uncharacterized protein (DUF2141 family)
MNTIFKLVFLIIIAQLNLFGQSDLVVEVSGIKAIQGELFLSMYNVESKWMYTDSAFRTAMVPVKQETENIVFNTLPPGNYAIAVYQDLNSSGGMDETERKIPKEPFGFSNNPKGIRGPASFQQALFSFDTKDTIRIELVNNIFTPNKEKNEKRK